MLNNRTGLPDYQWKPIRVLFNLNTLTYTFLDDPQSAPLNVYQVTQITY